MNELSSFSRSRGVGDHDGAGHGSSAAVERLQALLGHCPSVDLSITAPISALGDDTPVEPRLCRDWGNWPGPAEASSPGREAVLRHALLGDALRSRRCERAARRGAASRNRDALSDGGTPRRREAR